MIGGTLAHYRILEFLGSGGRAVVYKAEDLRLGRQVALKLLSAACRESEEEVQRFLREARAVAAIEHPNLCTVYEIGEAGGQLYLAMAFHEGDTLRFRIDCGPLALAFAADVAAQIASGLAKAHERGIVHRDVKPDNVLVTVEGQAKVLDFGIAQLTGHTRLTNDGSRVGTAAYMSPEQLRGEPGDPRMDVWSLGVVLYEMVTGREPFSGEGRVLAGSILRLDPRPMNAWRPEVPEDLQRIVSRALAKRPEDRYPGVAEMRADLRALPWAVPPAASGEGAFRAPAAPLPMPGGIAQVSPDLLRIGRTVAQYRILERLAGGGMGVVYEAEDTLLGRRVALKLLAPRLTVDPEGKERLLREAQAASAMDHPNLCTIYEANETEDGQLYLAMPLYDGETLRERLRRGALPVAEAVDIARQAALGLARVHRQGIVHRDVKPANLMVTSDGVVKILDFGIAKPARDPAGPGEGASAGTPAYRSPEQTDGGQVDARTDLWSLGVVLYEMLAGRRPFRGDHEQAVSYAVLHAEPDPMARPEVPPELEGIVRRLLAKDPAGRYPAAAQVAADLRALSPDESGARAAAPAVRRRAPAAWRKKLPWRWLGAVMLGIGLVAVLFLAGTSSGPFAGRRLPAGRPEWPSYRGLTSQPGIETSPSLSPDGETFLYAKTTAGNMDIFRQEVGKAEAVNLTADNPSIDDQPAFSPDGERIAFRSERGGGGLFIMAADGSGVRRISAEGFDPDWSPDGLEVAYATEQRRDPSVRSKKSSLWRMNVETGERRPVSPDDADAVQPSWSPNGLRIAYWGTVDGRRIVSTVSAEGGTAVRAIDDVHLNWSPAWSPNGDLYFASNRGGSTNLWKIRIEEQTGRVLGGLEAVSTPSESSAQASFSRDGRRLVYAADDSRSNIERAPFDLARRKVTGPLSPVTQGSQAIRSAQVSPDGRWIVYDTWAPQEDLFLFHLKSRKQRRLTDDPHQDRIPRWSADSSQIVFYSNRDGSYRPWTIRREDGRMEPMTAVSGNHYSPILSPAGGWMAVMSESSGGALVDLAPPVEERRLEPLVRKGPFRFVPTSWSPDGRWLAGNGRHGAAVYSLVSRRPLEVASRCADPAWLDDGRTLVCFDGSKLVTADVRTGKTRELLEPPPNSRFLHMSASAHGGFLYVVRLLEEGDLWMRELQ